MRDTLSRSETDESAIHVLIADDEESVRDLLLLFLTDLGADVDAAVDGQQAMEFVHRESYDLILLDLMMPVQSGLQALKAIRKLDPEVPVLIMTAFGTIETAVEAMKSGANDFLVKPLSAEEIDGLMKQVRRRRDIRALQELEAVPAGSLPADARIVTCDFAMLRLLNLVRRIAPLPSTVLIQGESGTGKELFARAIHDEGGKPETSFVAINCGAIPDQLLESELFGYERGAFTGANSRRIGLFEAANDGTIFLDEIGEMSMDLQVRLLRVIQERKIRRLGDTREIPTSARIVASTNRNLNDEVKRGRFRRDLYYRINVVRIEIPPLRDRPEDVELLARHFLADYSRRFHKLLSDFEEGAMVLLRAYSWDGNVRELQNVIERAAAVAEGERITADDLPSELRFSPDRVETDNELEPFGNAKRRFEKEYLNRVMERAKGNVSLAARMTSIPRQHLYDKLEKHGINVEDFRTV